MVQNSYVVLETRVLVLVFRQQSLSWSWGKRLENFRIVLLIIAISITVVHVKPNNYFILFTLYVYTL